MKKRMLHLFILPLIVLSFLACSKTVEQKFKAEVKEIGRDVEGKMEQLSSSKLKAINTAGEAGKTKIKEIQAEADRKIREVIETIKKEMNKFDTEVKKEIETIHTEAKEKIVMMKESTKEKVTGETQIVQEKIKKIEASAAKTLEKIENLAKNKTKQLTTSTVKWVSDLNKSTE
ncbi:MAG: hypothetical protein WBB70_11985 [Desulfobacterales bacterium]|jgi:hypothetical protein